MSKLSGTDSKSTLYCSFCGKSQHEVRKLIAGPTVFICDECVELCNDIIQSTVNVNMPSNLIRNDNPGPINGFGKTNKIFVADAQVWQIIRDWLHTVGIRCNWW